MSPEKEIKTQTDVACGAAISRRETKNYRNEKWNNNYNICYTWNLLWKWKIINVKPQTNNKQKNERENNIYQLPITDSTDPQLS